MVKNHKLSRKILDSGWGTFVRFLKYKTNVIEVPPHNTSVNCSRCGAAMPKSLAVRIHVCNMCGLILDRDHNVAINILYKGFEILKLPQELRKVTPVEITKWSMKQEEDTVLDGSGSQSYVCVILL